MPLRVVIDANVHVSAVLTPKGKPNRIIQFGREGHLRILASPSIFAEIRKVLLYPKLAVRHQLTEKAVDEYLAELGEVCEFTKGELSVNVVEEDPDDNQYLACAIEGGAAYIISGDRHLRRLKEYGGVRILTPADFLMAVMRD